jgi:hypothetical protein
VLTRLARRTAVSPAASREMLDILARERADNIVGRLLPDTGCDGRPLRRSWRVASKSGAAPGIRNDVALVQGNGLAYVIALMSHGCEDLRFSPDNEATLRLARIARAVHDQVAAAG